MTPQVLVVSRDAMLLQKVVGEDGDVFGYFPKRRGLNALIAVAAHVIGANRVDGDEKNIRVRTWNALRAHGRRQNKDHQQRAQQGLHHA